MEQAVWLTFGVIAIIVALTITVQLISSSSEQQKADVLQQSMQRLKGQCNLVCDSPEETLLSIDVELPSGILFNTAENKLCAYLDEQPYCSQCNCNLSEGTVLNLTSSFARKAFSIHAYSCSFLKGSGEYVSLECKG
jgi:hypothetical protein